MSASVFQAPGNRAENFIATVNASALPDPSTLNNGDYYIIQTGGTLWGKTWANGDRAISDGTAYSQDVDATKQVSEGGTGATTPAGARTNLGVNGIHEIAESIARRLVGPSIRFNGSSSVIIIADDDKLSFVTPTDDAAFAIEAWIKMEEATNFPIVARNDGSAVREYALYVNSSDKLDFFVYTDNTNYIRIQTDDALTSYEGKWIHVLATYGGSGPNMETAFANGENELALYINAEAVAATATQAGTFAGMSNTARDLWIGKNSASFAKGEMANVTLWNRELVASEAPLAMRGELGFADEWAGALGGVYAQDSTPSGEFNGVNATDTDEAGPIGGKSNVLKLTINTASSASHYATFNGAAGTAGKRLRLKSFVFIPSTNSNCDGFRIYQSGGSLEQQETVTTDTWVPVEFVFVSNGNSMVVGLLDGSDFTFADAGSDDVLYLAELTITQIGILADLRAENFDESTGKLYDESSNAFVGVNNGAALVGRALPVYKPGTFTPGLTFGGGNTGMVVAASEGYLTRDGNLCHIEGMITLSAKGTSTGAAVITGLEFLGPNLSGNNIPVTFGRCANMANLTSPIIGNIVDNSNTIALQDVGAAGSVDLDETNFTDTTVITFSATYRIQ